MSSASPWPTRKWWATQVTAVAGLVIAWITVGNWNQQLSIALVTLVAQALVGYLTPNLSAPSPAPAAREEPAARGAG
jgi:hypothetical protein